MVSQATEYVKLRCKVTDWVLKVSKSYPVMIEKFLATGDYEYEGLDEENCES